MSFVSTRFVSIKKGPAKSKPVIWEQSHSLTQIMSILEFLGEGGAIQIKHLFQPSKTILYPLKIQYFDAQKRQ